ncbi:hypothetical protein PENTCL1PPCAC_26897 [Pristionchus entomophagus]|uniref:Membrane transporter n=1 Tax=Pristionchus entomophagus TaxID=358040 RepID=A0AAV5UEG0_9BILA|nr:hypothetical protein PENTCL1PPCAC_26897 [Pristionchus entomophagus]
MRNIICLLILLALTVSLCLRTFISILIVVMVRPETDNSTIEIDDDLLDWDLEWKSTVLASPLIGCIVSLPLYSRFLAQKYSPKWIVMCVILFQSCLSFISPLIARSSLPSFIILRFFLGLAEGCVMPALNTIAAAWFPPIERVFKVAIYTCGFQLSFGGVQYLISFLSSYGVPWPWIFYGGGAIGLLFSNIWMFFVADTPSASRFIKPNEKKYIEENTPKTGSVETPRTPWKAIFSSPVIYTHLLCMSGFYFAIGVTSNLLPLYFKEELGMPITKTGVFTFVPFIAQIISKFIAGFMVDWNKKKRGLGHTKAAKFCQTLGSMGSALSLFILPFCHVNHTVAFIALVSYGATFSLCVCGFYTSMTMIAPRYTGSIVSLVTTVGMVFSLIALLVFKIFVWIGIPYKFFFLFGIAGVLQVMGGGAYLVWGTADVQPWATSPSPPTEMVMKPLLKDTKVVVTTYNQ